MSQVLERLMPMLHRHLSGDTMFIANDDDVGGIRMGEVKRRERRNHARATGQNDDHDHVGENESENADDSRGHRDSAQRWRHCLSVWLRVLGSERLFLALLFHSGALWAEEWPPTGVMSLPSSCTQPSSAAAASSLGGEEQPRRSWSKDVMWFLQLHEEVNAAEEHQGGDNVNNNSNDGGGSNFMMHHIHSVDEASVKHVAMGLLTEWFTMVDKCGKRFARAYYFSCVLKIAALVTNDALAEDIPHLHNLFMREPRSVLQFGPFCGILCCCLVEEAEQQQPFRLQLPPPFFLLNFNLIGRGSRIGVWLPKTSATGRRGSAGGGAAAAAATTITSSNSNNNGGSSSGAADSVQEGEFHSCKVCSPGVMLRLPSSSSTIGTDVPGDLILGVRLLDEVYARVDDVLPAMDRAGNNDEMSSSGELHEGVGAEKKRRGRGRREKGMSASSGGANAAELLPQRCWSAFSPFTQSYIRVDLLSPRSISAILPSTQTAASLSSSSMSTSSTGPGRRRAQEQQEMGVSTEPLRRSTRSMAQRDFLVTILIFLEKTARRLVGSRGIFLQKARQQYLPMTTAAVRDGNNKGDVDDLPSKGRESMTPPPHPPSFSGGRNMSQHLMNNTNNNSTEERARGTSNGNQSAEVLTFSTAEEEQECLIECAVHLLLEALLLRHALSIEVLSQVDLWTLEVTSCIVDLVLATPQPVVRLLYAVGYAFCLVSNLHTSPLAMVGFFATLLKRQLESRKNQRNTGGNSRTHDGDGDNRYTRRHDNVFNNNNNNNNSGRIESSSSVAEWWEVFNVCVLKNDVMSGQLGERARRLVERAVQSLGVKPHARPQRQHHSAVAQRLQESQQDADKGGISQETGSAVYTIKKESDLAEDGLALHDDVKTITTPRRSMALRRSRPRPAEDGPDDKRMKREGPAVPTWLRPTPVVEVSTQSDSSSLHDVIMALWWSLEQSAADAAGAH